MNLLSADEDCPEFDPLTEPDFSYLYKALYPDYSRFCKENPDATTGEARREIRRLTRPDNPKPVIEYVAVADEIYEPPPENISEINGLKQIPINSYGPGVYFLCKGDCLMYIGQSINPSSRIVQHKDKDFDRVYFISVPVADLNNVEAALIRHFKPSLQYKKHRRIYAPRMSESVADVVARYLQQEGSI